MAVFFGAHADDIELGAGGTCAKLSANGVEVHVVIATDEVDAKVARVRRGEAVTAAGVLGVPAGRVHFLGLSDGAVRCDRASVGKARALLAARGLRPDIVFTHTEWDSHQDHVELTRIVRGTVRQAVIFKYIVRNSAIVSHFTPCVYSAVDDFIAAKSAALCEHQSQVAVGRVDVDVFLNFAKRYSFNLDRRHFEAFDLEVQEGVNAAVGLVDLVNDAPFSRLWQPICGTAGVTVIPGRPSAGIVRCLVDRAPGDLQLVTRLQAELTRMLQGMGEVHAADMLVVAPATPTALDSVTGGACILLGGPDTNIVTRSLLATRTGLPFQMGIASDRHGGSPIIDVRTGQLFKATFDSGDAGGVEVVRDHGLLSMFRLETGLLVISAAGVHQAGVAAALSCLTRMDHVARIVTQARAVIEGSVLSAQWLIPCDGQGNPALDAVRSVVEPAREHRVAEKQRERAGRGKTGGCKTVGCKTGRRRRVQQQLSKAS